MRRDPSLQESGGDREASLYQEPDAKATSLGPFFNLRCLTSKRQSPLSITQEFSVSSTVSYFGLVPVKLYE